MKSELGKRLQQAIDAKGCLAPRHKLSWGEEKQSGYIELQSGLQYIKSKLIAGHRRPARRRKQSK
jgi:hypothetical protein